MARRAVPILTLVAAFGLGSCVSTDSMPIGPDTYPPRPDDWPIDVYVGVDAPVRVQKSIEFAIPADQVPADAKLIGRVDSVGADLASWGSVVNSAKKRARDLGGDALVIGQWGSPTSHVGAFGTVHHNKALMLSVLRYSSHHPPRQ